MSNNNNSLKKKEKKKTKKRGGSFQVLPIAQEESENFKTHFIELSVDQLLEEQDLHDQSNPQRQKKIKNVLGTIRESIQSMVQVSSISIIGSFHYGILDANQNIDMLIEIPKAYFEENDIKDFFYFKKRQAFVLQVAKALCSCDSVEQVTTQPFQQSPCKFYLTVQIKNFHMTLKIFFRLEEDTFPVSQLLGALPNAEFSMEQATFFYNHEILEDCFFGKELQPLFQVLEKNSLYLLSFKLLRLWIKQNNFAQDPALPNSFFISQVFLYCLEQGLIKTAHTTPLLVFKAVLFFLSKWPLKIQMKSKLQISSTVLEGLTQHCQVVFMDQSGVFNLAARMNKNSVNYVRAVAELALHQLDSPLFLNAFEQVFLTKRQSPLGLYDMVAKITNLPEFDNHFDRISFQDNVIKLLQMGLGARVTRICVLPSSTWRKQPPRVVKLHKTLKNIDFCNLDLTNSGFSRFTGAFDAKQITISSHCGDAGSFTLGLALDPILYRGIVEFGPSYSVDQTENEFSTLWKELAEVRRFKDGKIVWAVVWEEFEKPATFNFHLEGPVAKMMEFLLEQHLNLAPEFVFDHQVDQLYFTKKPGPDTTAYFLQMWTSLEKKLKSITSLPLMITKLNPISSIFRKIGPIALSANSHFDVVAELEQSSKWPDNFVAVQKVKTAFLIYLKNALRSDFSIDSRVTEKYLIVSHGGVSFRIHICLPEEFKKFKSQQEIDLIHQATHANYISSFSLSSQILCLTTELALRWKNNQLFTKHLSNNAVELLVASIFSFGAQKTRRLPINPLFGFLEFLWLMGHWDFQTFPIVVDVGNVLTESEVLEIEEKFSQLRKTDPKLCSLYIATPYDKQSTLWTKYNPSRMILTRLQKIARNCYNQLSQLIQQGEQNSSQFAQLFVPSFAEFNVVVNLKPRENWVDAKALEKFANELQEQFGPRAEIFFDGFTGTQIGLVWNPQEMQPVAKKQKGGFWKWDSSTEKFEVNMQDQLFAISRIGKGVIERVVVQN